MNGIHEDMLSGQSRQYNQRWRSVNLKTNLLSWIVEFVGQLISGVILLSAVGNFAVAHVLTVFGFATLSVFTPAAHLINETRIKEKIMHEGWLAAVKSMLHFNPGTLSPPMPALPQPIITQGNVHNQFQGQPCRESRSVPLALHKLGHMNVPMEGIEFGEEKKCNQEQDKSKQPEHHRCGSHDQIQPCHENKSERFAMHKLKNKLHRVVTMEDIKLGWEGQYNQEQDTSQQPKVLKSSSVNEDLQWEENRSKEFALHTLSNPDITIEDTKLKEEENHKQEWDRSKLPRDHKCHQHKIFHLRRFECDVSGNSTKSLLPLEANPKQPHNRPIGKVHHHESLGAVPKRNQCRTKMKDHKSSSQKGAPPGQENLTRDFSMNTMSTADAIKSTKLEDRGKHNQEQDTSKLPKDCGYSHEKVLCLE